LTRKYTHNIYNNNNNPDIYKAPFAKGCKAQDEKKQEDREKDR
jgi:hypothetical protein